MDAAGQSEEVILAQLFEVGRYQSEGSYHLVGFGVGHVAPEVISEFVPASGVGLVRFEPFWLALFVRSLALGVTVLDTDIDGPGFLATGGEDVGADSLEAGSPFGVESSAPALVLLVVDEVEERHEAFCIGYFVLSFSGPQMMRQLMKSDSAKNSDGATFMPHLLELRRIEHDVDRVKLVLRVEGVGYMVAADKMNPDRSSGIESQVPDQSLHLCLEFFRRQGAEAGPGLFCHF